MDISPKEIYKWPNKHMKRCLISLTIMEIQIKTTVRYHFTPIRMEIHIHVHTHTHTHTHIGKDEEKLEPLYIGCMWECKMVQRLWKTDCWFLKKLPYSPATPLLGIYPKEVKVRTQTHTWTPIFTAALFTIAKHGRKQHKCSTDEWINKMQYIPTIRY